MTANGRTRKKQHPSEASSSSEEDHVFDLTHLALSEDAILQFLESQFCRHQYTTWIGPVLLALNPYKTRLELADVSKNNHHLKQKVSEIYRDFLDTKQSQTLLFCGESGSGKSFFANEALFHLYSVTASGLSSDSYTHLSAALTILWSLGTASTQFSPHSSRIGYFIQNYIENGSISRAKIHPFYIDHARMMPVSRNAKSYHIFYQMLAGLTSEERGELFLDELSDVNDFTYLSSGYTLYYKEIEAAQFKKWKLALATLGISFSDVMRIFAAVMLLGNICFMDGMELHAKGQRELKAVAALLGVSEVTLYRGLVTRSWQMSDGTFYTTTADVNGANSTKDALARTLYIRTVHAITRKFNSAWKMLKKTEETDSEENCTDLNPIEFVGDNLDQKVKENGLTNFSQLWDYLATSEVNQQHCPMNILTAGQPVLKRHAGSFQRWSPLKSSLQAAAVSKSEGFIGVVDLFGFDREQKISHLEQLAINLSFETLQSCYNAAIFHPAIEARHLEDTCCIEDNYIYFDNSPILDLISHPDTGILSLLRGKPDEQLSSARVLVQKLKSFHRANNVLFEPSSRTSLSFGICHSFGDVVYDAASFVQKKKVALPADAVSVFTSDNCTFGFASHLFTQEIAEANSHRETKGKFVRGLPRSGMGRLAQHNTFTEDFCFKLDALLKKIMHTGLHFVCCVRSNSQNLPMVFERAFILEQLQSLQVFQSVRIMRNGLSHKMKHGVFLSKYKFLLPVNFQFHSPVKGCQEILNCIKHLTLNSTVESNKLCWLFGSKHLFYSELIRQKLEFLKQQARCDAAVTIQANWKGYSCRKSRPKLKRLKEESYKQQQKEYRNVSIATHIPPLLIHQICKLNGIDSLQCPQIPPARDYSIIGNMKFKFPQSRTVTKTYQIADIHQLREGDSVMVLGPSQSRGCLSVKYQGSTFDVPHNILQLKVLNLSHHCLAVLFQNKTVYSPALLACFISRWELCCEILKHPSHLTWNINKGTCCFTQGIV